MSAAGGKGERKAAAPKAAPSKAGGRAAAAGPAGAVDAKLRPLLDAIEKDAPASSYLIYGDEALADEAGRVIAEALVPEASRDFNLEIVDGRVASTADVLNRVSTMPFFPGRKVVWLRGSGLFLSKTNVAELTERAREQWDAGRHERAARLFLQLLALAGCGDDDLAQQTYLRDSGATFKDVFGVAAEETWTAWARAISEWCVQREMKPASAADDATRLEAAIDAGLSARHVLVVTAPAVDARTRLYKTFQAKGAVVQLAIELGWKENELPDETLQTIVHERLGRAGKRVDGEALEEIRRRAGAGVRALNAELDKLMTYVGERPVVTREDVQSAFTRQKEAHRFDLTDALGERNAAAGVRAIHGLLADGAAAGGAIMLLGSLASGLRALLTARSVLDGELRGRWSSRVRYPDFRDGMATEVAEALGKMHPFRAFNLLKSAERYEEHELCAALEAAHRADRALKSSSAASRRPELVLEKIVLDLCAGRGGASGVAVGGPGGAGPGRPSSYGGARR